MYVCRICKSEWATFTRQCMSCGNWSSLSAAKKIVVESRRSKTIKEIASSVSTRERRIKTGRKKIDKLLNGGFVIGSVTLLAGEPGIGKSTLAMSLFKRPLYASGEETIEQIGARAARLDVSKDMLLMSESSVRDVIAEADRCDAAAIVIDSIQTVFLDDETAYGSVNETKRCTSFLVDYAKRTGCVVVIVGHIAKDGTIAGPEALKHLVDTVLYFSCEDEFSDERVLRVRKNRFGPSPALEKFKMQQGGLA